MARFPCCSLTASLVCSLGLGSTEPDRLEECDEPLPFTLKLPAPFLVMEKLPPLEGGDTGGRGAATRVVTPPEAAKDATTPGTVFTRVELLELPGRSSRMLVPSGGLAEAGTPTAGDGQPLLVERSLSLLMTRGVIARRPITSETLSAGPPWGETKPGASNSTATKAAWARFVAATSRRRASLLSRKWAPEARATFSIRAMMVSRSAFMSSC
mmetsp:Transcript_121695/g.303657  ORF Transcript_121695/g.303657 Transcript_121695/m.303657 type:complete len:212 (-) Transcript_121695:2830-3465(-)